MILFKYVKMFDIFKSIYMFINFLIFLQKAEFLKEHPRQEALSLRRMVSQLKLNKLCTTLIQIQNNSKNTNQ